MYAAWIERVGPPSEIHYGELPDPRPGQRDVLVRVAAIAVNPVDTFVRSGSYVTPLTFPFVIGRDLVGTVVAVGAEATGFDVGSWVWCNSLGHGGRQGAAAELAVVAAERLYHLPTGVDPVAGVAVLHPAATAYLALVTHGRIRSGDTALVAGAAGNVGRAAVTIAVRAGARVVATARAADLDECLRRGAAEVVDYHASDLADRLRRAAPEGVDLYLDTSGRNDLELALGLLAPRGRVLVVAGRAARPVLPIETLYLRDASVIGFVISAARVAELAAAADAVNDLLVATDTHGHLEPRAVDVLPLRAAAEAHRLMEAGQASSTRLVLVPEG